MSTSPQISPQDASDPPHFKIMTWNVNSITTVTDYHPWNQHKSLKKVLDQLGCDIYCFQEMKINKQKLERNIGLLDDYDAYMTFAKKSSYSGVATYLKSTVPLPKEAEEGFTGVGMELVSKVPFPARSSIGGYQDLVEHYTKEQLVSLDQEGRCIVTDHGMFVLFNVYFPNGSDRLAYKLEYYDAFERRVRELIESGREVLVVGDVNATHLPIDHYEGELEKLDTGKPYAESPSRKWIHGFLHPQGPMVDMFRQFHPNQQGAYTVWNTKLNCRPPNLGSRIDYILATKGLVDWFVDCRLMPDILGSDHCPVLGLLWRKHPKTGQDLMELLKSDVQRVPSLCTKYYPKFAEGKISSFFTKKDTSIPTTSKDVSKEDTQSNPTIQEKTIPSNSLKREASSTSVSSQKKPKKATQPTLKAFIVPKEAKEVKPEPGQLEVWESMGNDEQVKNQWANVFQPPTIPKCHCGLDCVLKQSKTKDTKGQYFYICSKPVNETCNFFKWKADVKK